MSIDRAKVTKEADKLLAAGRIDKAIEEYRKLLDDNPKDLPLMNRIGDLCVQAKRVGEAIDLFKRLGMTYERDGFTQKEFREALPFLRALRVWMADQA